MVNLNAHPAILIVDMQNCFCHTEGTFGKLGLPISNHAAVIPQINALRTLGHTHNIPIIFLRWALNADYSDGGLILKIMPVLKEMKSIVRGTWDAEVVDELAPDPARGETVVDKTRTTGFWNTTLREKLTQLKIDQLIVTGVGTNVCVESTVRDAFTNGWEVVVVDDATATMSDEEHRMSLKNMQWFGQVASVEDIKTALVAT